MPFGSILAAWSSLGSYFGCLGLHFGGLGLHFGGLGPHFGGLGRYPGHGLDPELTRGPRMGWIALRLEREQCFSRIQGSRG